VSLETLFCFEAQPLHTPVLGSEHVGQTSLPHSGQLLAAGFPQLLQMPIIDMAVSYRLGAA
jgi:hypothetical protein